MTNSAAKTNAPTLYDLYPALREKLMFDLGTVAEFTERAALLRSIDSTEPVTVDELGNTEPARAQAEFQLQMLSERCKQIAWQGHAREALQEDGLL